MIMAELSSKVPEVVGMEDVLTSDVFGLIKYIDPGLMLKDILNASVRFSDKGNFIAGRITEASYYFWPKLSFTWSGQRKVREPDIVIILKGEDGTETAVIVEVKYRSGKSYIFEQQEQDEEGCVRDQLAEEMMAVYSKDLSCEKSLAERLKNCNQKYLIFVTGHTIFPEADKDETAKSIEDSKITEFGIDSMYWVSWYTIYDLIQKKAFLSPILYDLAALLELKGFTPFNGFDGIDLSGIKLYDNYFFEEEFSLATGKEIKSIYNAMKKICKETSRVIEITKEYFENQGFSSLAGNSVMWDRSTHYKYYSSWLPYFQQMIFGKKEVDDKTAVGINIIFDDADLNNPIPFISCGLIKGLKPFGTGNQFYYAGWDDSRVSITCSNSIYRTEYKDPVISEIKNYFLPLDPWSL
jgi:mRNA-degrading endonuclease RelE of RelBE toxin-antitoxin system